MPPKNSAKQSKGTGPKKHVEKKVSKTPPKKVKTPDLKVEEVKVKVEEVKVKAEEVKVEADHLENQVEQPSEKNSDWPPETAHQQTQEQIDRLRAMVADLSAKVEAKH